MTARRGSWAAAALATAITAAFSCSSPPAQEGPPPAERPDEPPQMVNSEPPFRYPGALYAAKKQGNVTLRLWVDASGHPVADSTRIEESSGEAAFDSSAVAGSRDLVFVPAKLRGQPVGMTILFPVYFRHPEAPPLPGDSVLRGRTGS